MSQRQTAHRERAVQSDARGSHCAAVTRGPGTASVPRVRGCGRGKGPHPRAGGPPAASRDLHRVPAPPPPEPLLKGRKGGAGLGRARLSGAFPLSVFHYGTGACSPVPGSTAHWRLPAFPSPTVRDSGEVVLGMCGLSELCQDTTPPPRPPCQQPAPENRAAAPRTSSTDQTLDLGHGHGHWP